MLQTVFALIIVLLFALLLLHFAYTLYAIFFGAAYIPTSHSKIQKMLELSKIKSDDVVLDLGSGDGRILIACAKAGAKKCIGIEINPMLVWYIQRSQRLFMPPLP